MLLNTALALSFGLALAYADNVDAAPKHTTTLVNSDLPFDFDIDPDADDNGDPFETFQA